MQKLKHFTTKMRPDKRSLLKTIGLFIGYFLWEQLIAVVFDIGNQTNHIIPNLISLIISTGLAFWVLTWIYHYQSIHEHLKKLPDLKLIGRIVLLLLLLTVIIIIVQTMIMKFIAMPHASSANQQTLNEYFNHPISTIFIIINAVVIAPRIEEFCFRYLLINVEQTSKLVLSLQIIFSALLFSGFHMIAQIPDIIHHQTSAIVFIGYALPYFTIGLFLALVYAISKNYRYDMYIHSGWNLLSTIILLSAK